MLLLSNPRESKITPIFAQPRVVWRLDRHGRNLANLGRLIAELEQREVSFESLTEKIETTSPTGCLVFHVLAALADSNAT
jgi:DNA invertase Pin-like site-specific DNA recombinase